MYLDAYENFGWVADDSARHPYKTGPLANVRGIPARQFNMVTLNLKRDRKILKSIQVHGDFFTVNSYGLIIITDIIFAASCDFVSVHYSMPFQFRHI